MTWNPQPGDEVRYQCLDPRKTEWGVMVRNERGNVRLNTGELITRGIILEVRHKESP